MINNKWLVFEIQKINKDQSSYSNLFPLFVIYKIKVMSNSSLGRLLENCEKQIEKFS